jgi:hypothetical protein
MAQVAARLAEFKVHGLLIIGGFEVSFIKIGDTEHKPAERIA